jgi:hypothetical protein
MPYNASRTAACRFFGKSGGLPHYIHFNSNHLERMSIGRVPHERNVCIEFSLGSIARSAKPKRQINAIRTAKRTHQQHWLIYCRCQFPGDAVRCAFILYAGIYLLYVAAVVLELVLTRCKYRIGCTTVVRFIYVREDPALMFHSFTNRVNLFP